MRPSPLLSAAAAVAVLAAVAAPATAATEPAPAKGLASSSLTVLGVTAGGQTVSAGTLELLSDMLGAESVARILLTPLTANGTSYGQQVVTPATSPGSAPSVSTAELVPALNGLVGLSSPALGATSSADGGEPSTAAGASSLGGLEVLGLPVALDGSVDVLSAVTRAGGATGAQTVEITDLALPSIADLLGALGLDLRALPIDVLNELLRELKLVTPAVDAANKALEDATKAIQAQIDAAQAEVDKAAAALAAEVDKLAGANSQLAAAEKDLADKTAALAPLRTALSAEQQRLTAANATLTSATTTLTGLLGSTSIAAYEALTPALKAVLDPTGVIAVAYEAYKTAEAAVVSATAAVTQATSDLAAAQSLVDVAAAAVTLLKSTVATIQAAVDGLQRTLDAAVAALRGVLTGVQPLIDRLLGAITAVLDGTPLVSFDSLSIVSKAVATSNRDGGQSAQVTGGELAGLRVLGTDVLSDVLGTTSIDLLDLTSTQLAAVNGLIGTLTGTLSSVLSTVPQFPTLSIPAPQVGLLTKSTSTGITDGFGTAGTSVQGLSISIPAVRIPAALALPGAADLPALSGVSQVTGLLQSAPVRLELATLSSNSRFAPAVAAAPGTGAPGTGTPDTGAPGTGTPGTGTPGTVPVAGPQLPRTGASQALAGLAVLLTLGALVARRRVAVPGEAGEALA